MSFSNCIALGGLIVSTIGLLVTITGGVLAILGYRRVIKSADENAKERQAAIDKAAQTLQDIAHHFTGSIKRDKYLIVGFMLVMALGFFWIGNLAFKLGDKVKQLEQKETRMTEKNHSFWKRS